MTEIQTSDEYFTSKVDEEHLKEIKKDMGKTELIGYKHNPQEGTVTCILNLQNLDINLRYIH